MYKANEVIYREVLMHDSIEWICLHNPGEIYVEPLTYRALTTIPVWCPAFPTLGAVIHYTQACHLMGFHAAKMTILKMKIVNESLWPLFCCVTEFWFMVYKRDLFISYVLFIHPKGLDDFELAYFVGEESHLSYPCWMSLCALHYPACLLYSYLLLLASSEGCFYSTDLLLGFLFGNFGCDS